MAHRRRKRPGVHRAEPLRNCFAPRDLGFRDWRITINAALLPLAFLLILINIGYTVSAAALLGEKTVLIWIVTSWYLAVTALFFAAMLGANTERRLAALMRGCMVAGVIAAFAGVAAYFKLIPGSAEFLLYDRARGTFKDPNVFGAFLNRRHCRAAARTPSTALRAATHAVRYVPPRRGSGCGSS